MKSRLEELLEKDEWTNDEMNELIALSPPGSWATLPNLMALGIKDLAAFNSNLEEGIIIANKAFDQGFYIEVISLRLQRVELYLRMYFVAKKGAGSSISPTDKKMFGSYIHDCEKMGFDPILIGQLKSFNGHRVEAIHKFLIGDILYSDLKQVCIDTKGLDLKVRDYVFEEIGVSI